MRTSVYNRLMAVKALDIATRINGAVNGLAIDRNQFKNQARSVGFVVFTGTITDGTHTVTMEDSDNGSVWAAAPAQYIEGTLPAIVAADDNKVFDFAYVGSKQFVRVVITGAGATTGGTFGAVAMVGNGRRTPIARA